MNTIGYEIQPFSDMKMPGLCHLLRKNSMYSIGESHLSQEETKLSLSTQKIVFGFI